MPWPAIETLDTARLVLEPLTVEHAPAMVAVLAHPSLYEFTGGLPVNEETLAERYARQIRGASADGSQGWMNWVIRDRSSSALLGFVQATLTEHPAGLGSEIGWLVTPSAQGHGVATEAIRVMVRWLEEHDVRMFAAHIHPQNESSKAVARKLRFAPTDVVVDGEVRWERASGFVIRQAAVGDIPELCGLWDATGIGFDQGLVREEVLAVLAQNPELVLVAVDETGIFGSVLGTFDGRRGWVNRLATRPDRRALGIAKALMRKLEEELQKKGARKVNLLIEPENDGVVPFYANLGFATDELIFMEKYLD